MAKIPPDRTWPDSFVAVPPDAYALERGTIIVRPLDPVDPRFPVKAEDIAKAAGADRYSAEYDGAGKLRAVFIPARQEGKTHRARVAAKLRPFIGRPIDQALIDEMVAELLKP